MKQTKLESLQTVKNYSVKHSVTASYIYKLEREGKMELVVIDGVKFIPTDIYPEIPVANRRK